MTIESLVEKYTKLCKKYGCTNVKSITPIKYILQSDPYGVINGTVELEVTTYTRKTITIRHTDQLSYINNVQILKEI